MPLVPANAQRHRSTLSAIWAGALCFCLGLLPLSGKNSGEGQVVDVAMTEGAHTWPWLLVDGGRLLERAARRQRAHGGAPYYGCYETKDGKFVSVGSIEKFYALLLEDWGWMRTSYPHNRTGTSGRPCEKSLQLSFARKRAMNGAPSWRAPTFVSPLSWASAGGPARSRQGSRQFRGSGRYRATSTCAQVHRTPASVKGPPPVIGAQTQSSLTAWGFSNQEVDALVAAQASAKRHNNRRRCDDAPIALQG